MFTGGYLGKVLRVNLSTREYSVECLDESEARTFLGGRGLAALCYYREVSPEIGPLEEGNELIFFTGPLTGVSLPSTTKFSVSTKSPETGIYLCSNSGGDFGPQLKFCGFDGLIIEGRAERPTYLAIENGAVNFQDATHLLGLRTSEVRARLRAARCRCCFSLTRGLLTGGFSRRCIVSRKEKSIPPNNRER
jgi:aldehyde:ferredoxin oxidoreductase